MVTRVVSASLWFVAIGWASNLASAFAGLPPVLGLAAAAAIAAFFAADPLGHLWPHRKTVVRTSVRATELARVVQVGR